MSEMLDKATEKYFDEKFKNLHSRLDELMASNSRNEDKIDIIEKDVTLLNDFKATHEKHHESKEKNMKFNLEMWVIVGIFLIDKIFQYIDKLPKIPTP